MKELFLKAILPLIGIAGILIFVTGFNPITSSRADQSQTQTQVTVSPTSTCTPVGACPSVIINGCGFRRSADGCSCEKVCAPTPTPTNTPTATPTCIPLPACVFAHPACKVPQNINNCPLPTATPTTPPSSLTLYMGIVEGTEVLSDFTIHVHGANGKNTDFPAVDYPFTVPLDPGSYAVTESVVSGYSVSTTGDCSGTIVSGEQKTCTITFSFIAPTPTGTVTPTDTPTPTDGSGSGTTNCPSGTQVANNGSNNNGNCNQQDQDQDQDQDQSQNNNQTIENNANNSNTVNISLAGNQQVLGAATAPTTLPSTGAEPEILLGLLTLAPIGWKIRKLI